jgi:hypothetical protein
MKCNLIKDKISPIPQKRLTYNTPPPPPTHTQQKKKGCCAAYLKPSFKCETPLKILVFLPHADLCCADMIALPEHMHNNNQNKIDYNQVKHTNIAYDQLRNLYCKCVPTKLLLGIFKTLYFIFYNTTIQDLSTYYAKD